MKKKPVVGHTPDYPKGLHCRYRVQSLQDGRDAMVLATGVLDKDGTFYEWQDKRDEECFHAKIEVNDLETGRNVIAYVPVSFIDWSHGVIVTWR